MEMARDEVRVMTVHGAKGLEAPIVILADTTTPPQGFHPPRLLQAAGERPGRRRWCGRPPRPTTSARWRPRARPRSTRRATNTGGCSMSAMTRAIERLIVCGVDGINKRPDGCWYDLAGGALDEHCVLEPADDGDGEVRRYRKVADSRRAGAAVRRRQRSSCRCCRSGCHVNVTAAARAAPIKPSGFVDDHEAAELLGPREARRRAILRGNITHRLMQSLPDIPPRAPRRGRAPPYRAAEHRLQRGRARRDRGERAGAARRSALRRAVRAGQPRRGADRRPASATRIVNGVVDRLVVAPDAVLIADYKTNRAVPTSLAEAAQALSRLYPPARALPRRAGEALPGPAGPCRFGVDGGAEPDGNPGRSPGCGAGRPHHA